MITTDLKYFLHPQGLIDNLDILCQRCSGRRKHQNLIICDGKEGFGKSTLTAAASYYMAYKMKRKLKLFFDARSLMEEARKSKDQVFIWDDAAYAALTVEAYNKLIIDLIKIIWLARKNRNTFFINIQEFFRLKELLVSRAIALLHVYSRDKIRVGEYAYFNEDYLIKLYEDWQRRKQKNYKKYFTFRGTFPNVLYKVFGEDEYETLKDAAIMQIGENNKKIKRPDSEIKLDQLRKRFSEVPEILGMSKREFAKLVGMPHNTLSTWAYKGDVSPFKVSDNPINMNTFIEPKSLNYLGKVPIVINHRSEKFYKPEEVIVTPQKNVGEIKNSVGEINTSPTRPLQVNNPYNPFKKKV